MCRVQLFIEGVIIIVPVPCLAVHRGGDNNSACAVSSCS